MLSFNHFISGLECSSQDFVTLLVCFFFTVYGILQSVKPAKYVLSSTKNKSHKKYLMEIDLNLTIKGQRIQCHAKTYAYTKKGKYHKNAISQLANRDLSRQML